MPIVEELDLLIFLLKLQTSKQVLKNLKFQLDEFQDKFLEIFLNSSGC